MPRSKKDGVKVEWNKHTDKFGKRKHNKKVRQDERKQVKKREE